MNVVIVGNGIAANSALRSIREIDEKSQVSLISDENEIFYSACVLPEYLSGQLSKQRIYLKNAEEYEKQNAELIIGKRVLSIDPFSKVLNMDFGKLTYDSLILATGSRAIILDIPGCHLPGNYVFKTLADTEAIMKEKADCFVVVGSGPIGIDACIALRARGCEVALVEKQCCVMPQVLDPKSAGYVKNALEELGVRILTGVSVVGVKGDQKVEGVVLENEVLPCKAIIWAVGVLPRVDLSSSANIRLGETGGFLTNEFMQTSLPDIYACGDCAETISVSSGKPTLSMLWHSAAMQGSIAGRNSIGYSKIYTGTTSQVVINLPNFSVGAVGSSGASLGNDVEILEWEGRSDKHWMIIYKDRIVGFQSINNMSYLGPMGNAIRQKIKPGNMFGSKKLERNSLNQIRWLPWVLRAATNFY